MRGAWQQTLLDEGVVDARLKRTLLAEQLGAVAAAGLVPSEVKVTCPRPCQQSDFADISPFKAYHLQVCSEQIDHLCWMHHACRRCSCSHTAWTATRHRQMQSLALWLAKVQVGPCRGLQLLWWR